MSRYETCNGLTNRFQIAEQRFFPRCFKSKQPLTFKVFMFPHHPHFVNNSQLGYHWCLQFDDVQVTELRLVCEDTLSFDLLCHAFESTRMIGYARDALHYALVAEKQCPHSFWEFCFSDTYNMQSLFALDQYDIVTLVLLILEELLASGFTLPTVCYDLTAARAVGTDMTPATERLLKFADFVPFDFELSPMLVPPDERA